MNGDTGDGRDYMRPLKIYNTFVGAIMPSKGDDRARSAPKKWHVLGRLGNPDFNISAFETVSSTND